MSRGKVSAKKGHGSAAELGSKSSLFPNHSFHLDSDISLYTSFECQVKCTPNLESALSVTVHRITVVNCKYQAEWFNKIVCEIPKSFERSSPSNFRTQWFFIHMNSGKIFERDLLSSVSVAKSATQKPWVF